MHAGNPAAPDRSAGGQSEEDTIRPDGKIDFGDIPELTDEQSKNAERGRFDRPIKRQITARADADVLEWLKSHGKRLQSGINAIWRREMLASYRADK